MIEDDKDKVRRNLVTLSGFILASAYLKLKLPNKVFEVELPKETDKIWVVVLVVLTYAFWRFFHSDEARKARSNFASQYADCRIQAYDFLLCRDLKRVFNSKTPRWLNILGINAYLEQERQNLNYAYVRLTALTAHKTRRWPHKGFERRSGATMVTIKYAIGNSSEMTPQLNPIQHSTEMQLVGNIGEQAFTFPRWIEFFITLSAILILLVRSEIIPEVLIPSGMAVLAGLIALDRILS